MRRLSILILLAIFAPANAVAAPAGSAMLPGPVPFALTKVHDGDSFSGEALVWPGHRVRVNVRIRGIDAPELHAKCPLERVNALAAKQALVRRLGEAEIILLLNIKGDKYNGRVVADVDLGGRNLAGLLLEEAPVRAYDGGKRKSWCN